MNLKMAEANEPHWNLGLVNENTSSRFAQVSQKDVDDLIAKEENENTKKKTVYDVNIILQFMKERNENRVLEKHFSRTFFFSEFI